MQHVRRQSAILKTYAEERPRRLDGRIGTQVAILAGMHPSTSERLPPRPTRAAHLHSTHGGRSRVTVTEVLVVAKAPMLRLLRSERAVSDRFVAHILARTIRLETDLTDQLLSASEQRLARTLLLLAGCDGPRPHRHVLPDVSQEKIAEMVGTTRSRVNAFMVKFRKLGFIEDEGGVLQVNPALLLAVHDGEPGSSAGASPALSRLAGAEITEWNRAGR